MSRFKKDFLKKNIIILGTNSNLGKIIVVAVLYHHILDKGVKFAPLKA